MRLHIARIWPERGGEFWFYEEYANPSDGKVLRQRIMQLVRSGSTLHGLMYRLPGSPASYAGEWRKEHPFASLGPAGLHEDEGCRTLWMQQLETYFAGGMEGKRCQGDRPEIVNEHSEFYMGSSSIRSWIRGLDAAGKQVEGLSNPSEFRKISAKLL